MHVVILSKIKEHYFIIEIEYFVRKSVLQKKETQQNILLYTFWFLLLLEDMASYICIDFYKYEWIFIFINYEMELYFQLSKILWKANIMQWFLFPYMTFGVSDSQHFVINYTGMNSFTENTELYTCRHALT